MNQTYTKPRPGLISTLLMAALAVLAVSHQAHAAFEYRVPLQGLKANSSSTAPTTPLTVGLNSAVLPAGTVNQAYSYDLKQLLAVTGDSAYSASNVSWNLVSGYSLPTGLILGSDGVISGTPTVQNMAGTDFQVVASYKSQTGEQAFTIMVNGVVLQVAQIDAGANHACAVTTSGGVKCWGFNGSGQLGNGTTAYSPVPVSVSGLTSGVVSISGGVAHTCAVTTAGETKCWGSNLYGQLGDGTTSNSSVPVSVSGLTSGVASISTGQSYTCAVTTSGAAKCWGFNGSGQLGDGTTSNSSVPVSVSGLTSGVANISGGVFHTCAVTTSGGAKCWGFNGYGQLGNGTTSSSLTRASVSGLTSGVASISTGQYYTCAVTTSGAAQCWGDNPSGQLGNGTTSNSLVPVSVSGLTSGVVSVSVGSSSHTCAVTAGGAALCWGGNAYGQLGNGTTVRSLVPVSVSGLTSGVVSISGGSNYTCAALSSGAAQCWGYNGNGQLGNGAAPVSSSVPADVSP